MNIPIPISTNLPTEEMRRMNRLICETDALYHEIAVRFGISDSTMRLLYLLYSEDGKCALRALYRFSGLSKQTVHSSLNGLEQKEYVTILSESRKNKTAVLTDAGYLLCTETVARLIEAENRALAAVSDEELSVYFRVSEHFLTALGKERFDSNKN